MIVCLGTLAALTPNLNADLETDYADSFTCVVCEAPRCAGDSAIPELKTSEKCIACKPLGAFSVVSL